MIIAIDFDGTIVNTKIVGKTLKIKRLKLLARKVINSLYDEGHTIIINTLRTDKKNKKHLSQAINYLKKKGIKYHYINENADTIVNSYWGDTRKIACDINIDDKNIVPLVSWPIIYIILKVKTWLNSKSI